MYKELNDCKKSSYKCPKCGVTIIEGWHYYCPYCGQKLDWGDDEKEREENK